MNNNAVQEKSENLGLDYLNPNDIFRKVARRHGIKIKDMRNKLGINVQQYDDEFTISLMKFSRIVSCELFDDEDIRLLAKFIIKKQDILESDIIILNYIANSVATRNKISLQELSKKVTCFWRKSKPTKQVFKKMLDSELFLKEELETVYQLTVTEVSPNINPVINAVVNNIMLRTGNTKTELVEKYGFLNFFFGRKAVSTKTINILDNFGLLTENDKELLLETASVTKYVQIQEIICDAAMRANISVDEVIERSSITKGFIYDNQISLKILACMEETNLFTKEELETIKSLRNQRIAVRNEDEILQKKINIAAKLNGIEKRRNKYAILNIARDRGLSLLEYTNGYLLNIISNYYPDCKTLDLYNSRFVVLEIIFKINREYFENLSIEPIDAKKYLIND